MKDGPFGVVLAWYDGEEGGEMKITMFAESVIFFNAIVCVWQENNAL